MTLGGVDEDISGVMPKKFKKNKTKFRAGSH
jgi:hypothetical protein